MYELRKRINDYMYKAEVFFAKFLLIGIVLFVFYTAVLRSIPYKPLIALWGELSGFGKLSALVFEKIETKIIQTVTEPLAWSEDIAKLLFVWTAFIGADIALKKQSHIGIDIIVNKMPAAVHKYIKLGMYILIICFLTIVCTFGTILCFTNVTRQFNGLELSYAWATLSAPVGAFLMMRTCVIKIYGLFRPESDLVSEDAEEEEEGEGAQDCI